MPFSRSSRRPIWALGETLKKNRVLGAPDGPSEPLAKIVQSQGRFMGAPLTLEPSPKTYPQNPYLKPNP